MRMRMEENKNFKRPFSSKGKIRLNLSGVKHAQSRSGIGNYPAIRRARNPRFRGVLASWVI